MIAENLVALLAAVQTVPALAEKSGLRVGGDSIDPGMMTLALPAAWVMHASDKATDADGNFIAVPQTLQVTYFVIVFLPYTSQSDMLAVQLPLLESVITAVRGTPAPDGTQFAYRGQHVSFPDPKRMIYQQIYTLTATV